MLAACALLGITEVHAAGGAQAIAMLGYGTADCAPVDVITGPGNVYVAAAKRLLSGQVAVDAEAGPTEIAIIADDTADPAFLAADLVAQAEHDPLAACLLITTDPGLADRVDPALAAAVAATRHADRVRAALAGQSACVLVDDLDAALAVSDAWAPEHLEIQADGTRRRGPPGPQRRRVFVGPWAPVSLGDYLAGSNHVLPTGGHRAALRRAVGAVVPARHPHRRVRRGRAGRRRPVHRRPRRGRGPGRPRPGGPHRVPKEQA